MGKILYEGKEYGIMDIKYKDHTLPVLLDWKDYQYVKKLDFKWHCNNNGFICHSYNSENYNLHDLIMQFKNKEAGVKNQKKTILHNNKIGLDNRRINLMYDTVYKDINKNMNKKRRTVVLPGDSGIDPDTIPTYIWYMKPDSSHGERFHVKIGDVSWKSSSSNTLSLKYKLEEAKLYMRTLFQQRKDLFEDYSMNNDYTLEGKELSHTFYDIIHTAGYKNIKRNVPENNTLQLLQPNYQGLNEEERELLKERQKEFKEIV